MGLSILHGGHSSIGDGRGEPEEFALEATRVGLSEVGFSEHLPHPDRPDCLYPFENRQYQDDRNRLWDGYGTKIFDLRDTYRNRIDILLGCEVDFFGHHLFDWQKELMASTLPNGVSYDYLIGSVHFLDGIGSYLSPETFSRLLEKYDGDIETVYVEYFRTVQKMVETIDIDIVGHLGTINQMQKLQKEFAPPPDYYNINGPGQLSRAIRETLSAIKEKNLCLDANVGCRRNVLCQEMHPTEHILQYAAKLEIPITLGTDSHQPAHVGSGLTELLDSVVHAGYKEYATFDTRERRTIPLP